MENNDIYALYTFIFENMVKEKLKTAFSRTEVKALGFYAKKALRTTMRAKNS